MPFIEQSKIEEIKQAARIEIVVSESGVELKKSGASYMAVCPFHNGSSRTMSVHPVKNIFKCFNCGAGGDSIKFLTLKGVSFPDALKTLAERFNVLL